MIDYQKIIEDKEAFAIKRISEYKNLLNSANLKYEDLLEFAALSATRADTLEEMLSPLIAERTNYHFSKIDDREKQEVIAPQLIALYQVDVTKVAHEIATTAAKKRSKTSSNAAKARHDRGHYPSKREKIRKIWASGEYETRDDCAEHECAKLNVSFSFARKALRKAPKQSSS